MANATMPGIDGARAEILFKAQRFRELVGAKIGATPVEMKVACRQALLLHHPDKGGNAEVFKWVRPATEILLLDENLCTFEGRVPSWAKIQLVNLAELRRDITASASRLEVARSKIETTRSDPVRAKAQKDALMAERGLGNLRTILAEELKRFNCCYIDHKRLERIRMDAAAARESEAVAREVKAAADYVILKRRYQGVVVALRHRHQRGRTRFPIMPRAVTDFGVRAKLGVIRADYLAVVSATCKRTKRGGAIADLVSKSNGLLFEAHSLVDHCCNEIHAVMASHSKRFPVLPASDPRAPALAKLNKEQRRLSNCITRNTSDAQCDDIHGKIELLIDQAIVILESSDPVSMAV